MGKATSGSWISPLSPPKYGNIAAVFFSVSCVGFYYDRFRRAWLRWFRKGASWKRDKELQPMQMPWSESIGIRRLRHQEHRARRYFFCVRKRFDAVVWSPLECVNCYPSHVEKEALIDHRTLSAKRHIA